MVTFFFEYKVAAAAEEELLNPTHARGGQDNEGATCRTAERGV
jgi:hypothetical protein